MSSIKLFIIQFSQQLGLELNKQFCILPPSEIFEHCENQGVLLVNMSLTCEINLSNSHKNIWKFFTKQLIKLFLQLYDVFTKYDAELVEINPLFITNSNQLIAGDGKVMIDDNSMFRQTRFEQIQSDYKTEAEFDANQEGIPFIQFDGDIGLMCAGAGLTTTVYDLIHYEGGTVANYLEFGGPNYKKAVKAMEICLKVPSKVILIVTFGTIARADVMAEGIVDAINRLKPDRPIVTCIRGTNEIEAVKILKEAGLEPIFDTEEAVRKAVALASGGSK